MPSPDIKFFGLYAVQPTHAPPTPVPLRGVRVEAQLAGPSARVTVKQRFVNQEARPIEAVYAFPLDTDAAVCGFEAILGERRVLGHAEERDKAFEDYDDALADGNGAFLLDQKRPNVFTCSVGSLPPGKEATICIHYVVELKNEGEAIRFLLPTTIAPRYVPATSTPEIGQPDAERINPERWLEVPYGLTLKLEIAGAPREVSSPSHPIRTLLTPAGATVELAQTEARLDRDFVLLMTPQVTDSPQALVARDQVGVRHVLVNFRPDLPRAADTACEVLFLVDCSGSMAGDSITEARRALELCVRAVGQGDTFDVVRFGQKHLALWGNARGMTEASLAEATHFVQTTEANLGGTEILPALRSLLERPVDPSHPRQVLLLTDGQVGNEAEVIELARQHAATVRIFTFGIGASVSEHLVRELARTTRGACELISPGERIEPKVLRAFGRVKGVAVQDLRVDWGGLQVEAAPAEMRPIFAGEMVRVWARVKGGDAREVALIGAGKRWSVPIDLEAAPVGGPIPLLWARARIGDLEAGTGRHGSAQNRPERDRRQREELVSLCKQYGLVSSVVSYVAVETRADAEKTSQPVELRKVPVMLATGWGGVRVDRPQSQRPGHLRHDMRAPGVVFERPSASRARKVHYMIAPEMPAYSYARSDARSDDLYDLLATQRADGSFPLSPELKSLLRFRVNNLRQAANGPDGNVVTTALVLALLEKHLLSREAEWSAAAQKARTFLAGRTPVLDPAWLF